MSTTKTHLDTVAECSRLQAELHEAEGRILALRATLKRIRSEPEKLLISPRKLAALAIASDNESERQHPFLRELESCFEVLDCSDQEIWHTQGIFSTLEAAIAAMDGCAEPPTDQDPDESCRIEIRERKLGWSNDLGKLVRAYRWTATFDDATDENKWAVEVIEVTLFTK